MNFISADKKKYSNTYISIATLVVSLELHDQKVPEIFEWIKISDKFISSPKYDFLDKRGTNGMSLMQ